METQTSVEHVLTEPCKEVVQVVVVANVKEQESVTEEILLPATNENCTQSLPANGDGNDNGNGKVPAADENYSSLGASETEIIELGSLTTSLPETVPAPEANEPLWGDVPDDIPEEPILPPRPPKRPRIAPECEEVDDVVQTMRNILFNLTYEDDAHLSPEDEAKVRDLLEYHPKAEEKTGSGIDYIKIKRHSTFKDVRCFWVVRTDGTETDFSYHKCLKEKVAKDHPSFVDRYDAIYRAPKRPRQV